MNVKTKFKIQIMKTLLLSAILAFSINAFAQTNTTDYYFQHQKSNSSVYLVDKMNRGDLQTSNSYSEIIAGKITQHQKHQPSSLIQIYDSIYYWQWDTISMGWIIDSKTISIVYDVNHNLISEIIQSWDGSAWGNFYKFTFTYDANNNQISYLRQNWNGSAWVNSSQSTYTYDANNNLLCELGQSWNDSAWENSWQYTYTYDANNNQTCVLGQDWNGSAWENSIQYTYTYDANSFMMTDTWKVWNEDGTKVIGGDSNYYYFHTFLGINDFIKKEDGIQIYPNPTSGKFTINSNGLIYSIEIYNTIGELIYSVNKLNGQKAKEIDISDQLRGIYFIKIYLESKNCTKKIVVQ